MSASTPIGRIAQILESAGYKRVGVPLQIAGIKFEVSAAFVGTSTSQDLIVVADTAFASDSEKRLLRNVLAIARALDVAGSTRPLTVVVAGARPTASTMEALSKVCRVLPVGVADGSDLESALKNWLAILMPLHIPKPRQDIADPLGQVGWEARDMSSEIAALIDLAPRGQSAVEHQLYEILKSALSEVETSDPP
jgi:hypothetical protein